MCHIIPQKSMEEEINHVCQKKTVKGKTYSGYNIWCPETFHLFETICESSYLIRGFTNRDIRQSLYKKGLNPQKAVEK